ncbi:hypothetical protein D3C84_1284090 [compost metagenome]
MCKGDGTPTERHVLRAKAGVAFGLDVPQGSLWTSPVQHGPYRRWTDNAGNKRVKQGTPTSDLDGTLDNT